MKIYRIRIIDQRGEVIGALFVSFASDADAIRYADTAVDEYDCERVEVWSDENLIGASTQRPK